jgi:hypothetical protein
MDMGVGVEFPPLFGHGSDYSLRFTGAFQARANW